MCQDLGMFPRQEETSTYGLGDLLGAVGGYLGLFIGHKRRLFSKVLVAFKIRVFCIPVTPVPRLVLLRPNGGAHTGHSQGQGGPWQTAVLLEYSNTSNN